MAPRVTGNRGAPSRSRRGRWRILFGDPDVHAPTGAEAASFDHFAIDRLGVPARTLIENAGRSAALVLERVFPEGRVVVFAGSGNNGGDGLALSRALAGWGRPVTVVQASSRPPDARLLHQWPLPLLDAAAEDARPEIERATASAGVLVDAVLGTGISGAPRAAQARLLESMNQAERPLVSLDIPSGVDADTGAVPGTAARADLTVAFGWPKLGSLLQPGRAHAGRLVAVEIGFPPVPAATFGARVVTPGWAEEVLPVRRPDTHKHQVGSLLLLAGAPGMAGAAIMAARAALRAGAGFVRIASTSANRHLLQSAVPEAVFVDTADRAALARAAAGSTALVAGPGLGVAPEAATSLKAVLEASGDAPVLLDADALNLVAAGAGPALDQLGRARPVLLTPHRGEMGRLVAAVPDLPDPAHELALDRAAAWSCTVLLKGNPSVVATPGKRLLVGALGSSDLAAAGMGDVLSGVAGSLLAQGCDPPVAGGLALHLTGVAAVLGREGPGLVPGDVIARLAAAIRHRPDRESRLGLPFVTFDQEATR